MAKPKWHGWSAAEAIRSPESHGAARPRRPAGKTQDLKIQETREEAASSLSIFSFFTPPPPPPNLNIAKKSKLDNFISMKLTREVIDDALSLLGQLSVSYLGRPGQILLKFYAALNRAEARDLDDLHALGPNEQETIATLHWIFAHVPILSHRHQIAALLTHLGHEPLVESFKV